MAEQISSFLEVYAIEPRSGKPVEHIHECIDSDESNDRK